MISPDQIDMTFAVRKPGVLQRIAGAWAGWFNPQAPSRWVLAAGVASEAAQSLRDIAHAMRNMASQEKLVESATYSKFTPAQRAHIYLANQLGGILVRVDTASLLGNEIHNCDGNPELQEWLAALKSMDAGSFMVQRDQFLEKPTATAAMRMLTDVLDAVIYAPIRSAEKTGETP